MTAIAPRRRLSKEERRRQLLEAGRDLLAERGLEQVTVDAVTSRAGASKALLFHYFGSFPDYQLELLRDQGERLLEATAPDPALADDPFAMLRASLAAYVDFIEQEPSVYVSLLRGTASTDPAMRELVDDVRGRMAARPLALAPMLGIEPTRQLELAVTGWIAFVEEVTIRWLQGGTDVDREGLLDLTAGALIGVVGMAIGDG